jgi:alpha-1,3-rhamnosyl/mannosyltransferase
VGGQAHLIEPLNLDGWRQALLRVCTDESWWQSLRAGAVAKAQPYTWERCAADTLRVYRAVATGRSVDVVLPEPVRRVG